MQMTTGVAIGGNTFEDVVMVRLREERWAGAEEIMRSFTDYMQATWSRQRTPDPEVETDLDFLRVVAVGVSGSPGVPAGLHPFASLLICQRDIKERLSPSIPFSKMQLPCALGIAFMVTKARRKGGVVRYRWRC